MRSKKQLLQSWGLNKSAKVEAFRPERRRHLSQCCAEEAVPKGILAVGEGRSYGDVGLNHDGQVILTSRLDRMIEFDEEALTLRCESGVLLQTIQQTFLPRGYGLAVSPGTALVTVAGAVANDVHGKNHDQVGSFGEYVVGLTLLMADQSTLEVTLQDQPELFKATIGGLGLTGIIIEVTLRLVKASSWVVVNEHRIAHLDEFFDALAVARNEAYYSVGWFDCFAKAQHLGRGILQTAEYVFDEPVIKASPKQISLPCYLPKQALNSMTIKMFNQWYWRQVPSQGRSRQRLTEQFLYPLDRIQGWNKMYGRRGFYQFQCVLPEDTAVEGIASLLACVTKSNLGSFLAVLKTMGNPGLGYLSFPMKGLTLALDFPKTDRAKKLIQLLNAMTLEYGGRVYLAKDALLTAEQFRAMYGEFDLYQKVRQQVDPEQRWQSDMARRLAIA